MAVAAAATGRVRIMSGVMAVMRRSVLRVQ
jgi:hypothetical protein